MTEVALINADVLAGLARFPDNHFDSCVCDPPYELGFMGKKWDSSGISYSVDMWKEVCRVLKPGAHLLAFGGSRTYHRLACAIEDAGFIIRDQIMWLYGSGFPKSLDVSKAIDKAAGAEREIIDGVIKARPTFNNKNIGGKAEPNNYPTTAPATDLAHQWEGWGTALKPAHEPIVVARKPLEGTVVANVLKHGTGAINVAGCRIETDPQIDDPRLGGKGTWASDKMAKNVYEGGYAGEIVGSDPAGRWPANVIHDGSEEVLAAFPAQTSQTGNRRNKNRIQQEAQATPFTRGQFAPEYTNGGSPARFFYCAKSSPAERGKFCNHPTVKPLALMAYLVRLVTPPGGMVLDPFMGSGSTLIAAAKEGFDSVGIEIEAGSCEIAKRRCQGHLGMLAEIVNG